MARVSISQRFPRRAGHGALPWQERLKSEKTDDYVERLVTALEDRLDEVVRGVNSEYVERLAIGLTTALARLHVLETAVAEIARFEGSGQGQITFYDGATARGRLGFGSVGHLFSTALSNSLGLRAEGALHLGVGSTLAMTMREIGYGPGTGYVAFGGETDPLSVLEVGGEDSPEIGLRSNTTGLRYTLQSNSDKTLRAIDRSNSVDRMVCGDAQSLGNAAVRVLPNFDGVLFIVDHTGNTVGMFFLRKSTATQEVSDPSAAFTPTKDNAGTVNVYWDAVDSQMELQNNSGGARSFSYWLFGRS